MSKAVINANRSKGTIDRNIYGQFSEHLGRCIYNGVYVGEGSGIPNENGMRTDVVQALRALCQKVTPDRMEGFEAAVEQSLNITAVWKVHMEELSGKAKRER